MKFARWTFRIAGIYGILALLPQYFMINTIAEQQPPAITHLEFFFGFVGVALAFQVVFLVLSTDPVRYRLMIIPSVIEKFSFFIPCLILFLTDRLAVQMFGAACIDLVLGSLFIVSWFKTAGLASSR